MKEVDVEVTKPDQVTSKRTIKKQQGRIQKISKGGAINKEARQPNLPPFKKKNTPDLGYYFSKRVLLFSFFFKLCSFFNVYQENQRGPDHLSCNFPSSRRPEKALRGPKDMLDRSERTRATDNGSGQQTSKGNSCMK